MSRSLAQSSHSTSRCCPGWIASRKERNMASAVTKRQALKALAGMQEIVEHDMLIHGEYATGVVDDELAAEGAICGGRKYCAVGALWVGGGVSMRNDGWGYKLPGVNAY